MPDPTFTAPPTAPSRSDAPATFVSRADAFVAWFSTLYTELVAFVVWVGTKVSEINALVQGAGFTGTSATSLTIGTGSKSLTVQAGLSYVVGTFVLIADTSAPSTNFMAGSVTAYNSTTGALVVSVPAGSTRGSGTFTAWTVSLSGPPGPATAFATGAELRALTDNTKALTALSVADAAALVTLTDASTVVIDLATGVNFVVTLAGNRTLGAPSNAKPGTTGTILIKQDATGSRTLAYNAAWVPFGTTPSLTTTANAVDLLTFIVETSSKVRFTVAKGGAA